MSAEKDIVTFWLNRKGFFTVTNIKSGNKDIGILALKYENNMVTQIAHVEVMCSIAGVSDHTTITEKIIDEKFNDTNIQMAIMPYTNTALPIKKIIVLNSFFGDAKSVAQLREKDVEVLELETVMADVMKQLTTGYFKDDVIRSLQIMKFIMMANPSLMIDVLFDTLSSAKRKELFAAVLDKDEIIKEFRKTNEERMAMILKESMIKPERLAAMLEKDILNRRTRKPFVESLLEQQKTGKIYKQELKENKKDKILTTFFD